MREEVVKEASQLLATHRLCPAELPSHYLPDPGDREGMADYLLFMTAIDHRTGKAFSSTVEGAFFKGAELLWKLGELKWRRDRGFFKPARMMKVGDREVTEWLTAPSGVTVKGPGLRAILLRDAARWLMKLYEGSSLKLIEEASGSCRKLLELLRPFKAFNDPVAKKPYLLIKLLERAGLFKVLDRGWLRVPVDNHVARIALRLGLVEPTTQRRATLSYDVKLRMEVREAWQAVASRAGVDPLVLDDLLWPLGRELCRRELAKCVKGEVEADLLRRLAPWSWERCPFEDVCRGMREDWRRKLREPLTATWWY